MRLLLVLSIILTIVGCEPRVIQKNQPSSPTTTVDGDLQETVVTVANPNHAFPPTPFDQASDTTNRTLAKNWNLVSLPIEYPIEPQPFLEANPAIQSIWAWDHRNDTWKTYPQIETFESIQFLDPYQGYWLRTDYVATLAEVESLTPSYTLQKGWNLVGYGYGLPTVSADEFFAAIGTSGACYTNNMIVNAWVWKDDAWQVYFPDSHALADFNQKYNSQFTAIDVIEPGTGVWINTSDAIFPPALEYDGTYQISLYSAGTPYGLGTLEVVSGKVNGNLLTDESIPLDGCLGPNGTFTLTGSTQENQNLTATGTLQEADRIEGRYQFGNQTGSLAGILLNEDLRQLRKSEPGKTSSHFDQNYEAVLTKDQTTLAEFQFTVADQTIAPVHIQVGAASYTLEGQLTSDGRLRLNRLPSDNNPEIFLIEGGIDPEHFTLYGRFRLGNQIGELQSPLYLRDASTPMDLKISETSEIQPIFFDDGQSFTDIPAIEYVLEETHYAEDSDSEPPTLVDPMIGASTADQGILRVNPAFNDGETSDFDELETTETIPDYVTNELPNGVDSNTYFLIDTFDGGDLDSFQYEPEMIGLTSRPGWKFVNQEGDGAIRNEMTESPQTYYWKLSNTYDLSSATQAKLQIRYQFKKHLYENFHILVGEETGEMQLLQEITEASDGIQDQEFDLSDYLGQKIRIEFVLKKPNNVIERRIGLYVFQAGVILASPEALEKEEFSPEVQQTRTATRTSNVYPRMLGPSNRILSHSQPTFRWDNGTAQRVYLAVYTARSLVYYNRVYPAVGREITPQRTIALPFDEGAIRVKLTYQMPNGRWGNRYYFYYLRSGQLTWPLNGSTLSYNKTLFAWTRGNARSMYLNVYTRQGRVFYGRVENNFKELEVPTDQGKVYVNLWALMGNRWQYRRYTFNPPPPKLINPQIEYFFDQIEVTVNRASAPYVYFQVFYGNQYITAQFLREGAPIVSLPGQEENLRIRLWYPNGNGWWGSKDHFLKPGSYLPPTIGAPRQRAAQPISDFWDKWGPTVPPNFSEVWDAWKQENTESDFQQKQTQRSRIELEGDHWVRTLDEGWHMVLLPVEANEIGTGLSHHTLDRWFRGEGQVYSFFIWDAYLEQWAYYSRKLLDEDNFFLWSTGFPNKQKSLPIWVRIVGGSVQYEVGKGEDSPSFSFTHNSKETVVYGWSMVAYNSLYQKETTPWSFAQNVIGQCISMVPDSLWQWQDGQWKIYYFGRHEAEGQYLYSKFSLIESIQNGEGIWVRMLSKGICQNNATVEIDLPPDRVIPMEDIITQGLKDRLEGKLNNIMIDTGLTLGEFLNKEITIPSVEEQLEVYRALNSPETQRIGGLLSPGDGNNFNFEKDAEPAGVHGGDIFLTRAAGDTPWGEYSHSGMWMRKPPEKDRPIIHSTPQASPPIEGAELDGVQYAPVKYFRRYSRLVQVYHEKVRDSFYEANPTYTSPDEVAKGYYFLPYGAYFNKFRQDAFTCSTLIWRGYRSAYIDGAPDGIDLYPHSEYVVPKHFSVMTHDIPELKIGQIAD